MTDRWYIKPNFTEISYQDTYNFWATASTTDNNLNGNLPDYPSGEWLPSDTGPPAPDAPPPPAFYQVIVKRPLYSIIQLVGADKFDLSAFENASFLDAIKTEAAVIASNNLSSLGNKINEDPKQYLTILKENAYVTYRFHVDTGHPGAALISFQVLFSYGGKERAFQEIAEAGTMGPLEGPNITFAKYHAYRFMHPNADLAGNPNDAAKDTNTLSLLVKALVKAHERNDSLEEKYDINFLNIANELKTFQLILLDQYYDISDSASQRLREKWEVATGKQTGPSGLYRRELIEFAFNVPLQDVDVNDPWSRAKILRVAGYIPPSVYGAANNTQLEAEEEGLGYTWEENGIPSVVGAVKADDLSAEVKYLLYKADDARQWYIQNGLIFDVDDFVIKFIRPVPKKLPKPREATQVFNDGEARYKGRRALQAERLTDAQKAKIHARVLQDYNQVTDAAFLNVIRNSKRIKTEKDIYDQVLNAIPLDAIIQTAAGCLTKYLSDLNLRHLVCDTILRNLSFDELDKVLAELDTNTETEAKKLRMAMVAEGNTVLDSNMKTTDPTTGEYTSEFKNEIKSRMNNHFVNDYDAKDTLCMAIFAAIPAAIVMLQNLEATGDFLNAKLVNPAKEFLSSIADHLDRYVVLTLTADWSNMLTNMIIDFVSQFITQIISKMLEEIAYLCEGSSKSDFANMGTDTERLPENTTPVFPFEPAAVKDAIIDDSVYDDLSEYANVPMSLIEDFLDELGNLLTVSELCALMGQNPSGVNIDMIIDKIWYGLLSLDKFLPLKESLKNKSRLKHFIYILSKKVSQKHCVDLLKGLENTKKLLSDLCGPATNQALIDDLKEKASDEAIQQLLDQEADMTKGLLDAIKNINSTPNQPLFCGPETKHGEHTPLFESHQHPSAEYLNNDFMTKILQGIESAFEKDIGFYKPILTTGGGEGSFTRFRTASQQVAGAMAKLYKIDLKDVEFKETSKDDLDTIVNEGKIVASKVHATLTAPNGIKVIADSWQNVVELSTNSSISQNDVIDLKFNFDEKEHSNIPPNTARFKFGFKDAATVMDKKIAFDVSPPEVMTSLINSYSNLSTLTDTNQFDKTIQLAVVNDFEFYGLMLSQIVKEHAEYITTQNLFQKSNFDKLSLSKEDICDTSLLRYEDIFDDIQANVKLLQCAVSMGAVPSAQEICQINAFIELSVRVVIIKEFLRSLMVFAAFGMDSLLPEGNDSFYYNYLMDQILFKLSGNIKGLINDYSRIIYAVKQNKKVDEVKYADVAKDIIARSVNSVQSALNEKNQNLFDKEDKPNTDSFKEEFMSGAILDADISKQVLKNLVSGLEGILVLPPPKVESVDLDNKMFTVPQGYYSKHERLVNGGFFIEEGFDVLHKFADDPGVFTGATSIWSGQTPTDDWGDMFEGMTSEDTSKLKTLLQGDFGRAIFGMYEDQSDDMSPSTSTTLNDLDSDIVSSLSQENGKLARSKFDKYSASLNDFKTKMHEVNVIYTKSDQEQWIKQWLSENSAATGNELASAAQALLETEAATAEAAFDVLMNEQDKKTKFVNKLINDPVNKFFKRYNGYRSLNILIPVETSESMEAKWQNLKSITNSGVDTAGDYKKSFYEAVLDRKYFLREDNSDYVYFKLPLLIYYDDNSDASTPVNKWYTTGLQSLKNLQNYNILSYTPEELIEKIGTDTRFKDFINSIQYKELLSFLSILVAEMIESQYPALQPMFDGTLNAIQAALDTFISTANRNTNPDFYKEKSFNTGDPAAAGMDMNWVPMILEMLVKTMANTSDPTWKTPWFLPGPLTPMGIIAKILDSVEDDESEDPNAAADITNKIDETVDGINCEDDK